MQGYVGLVGDNGAVHRVHWRFEINTCRLRLGVLTRGATHVSRLARDTRPHHPLRQAAANVQGGLLRERKESGKVALAREVPGRNDASAAALKLNRRCRNAGIARAQVQSDRTSPSQRRPPPPVPTGGSYLERLRSCERPPRCARHKQAHPLKGSCDRPPRWLRLRALFAIVSP